MASGLLGLFGLARASHLRAAVVRANSFKERAADAKHRLEAAQRDTTHWKEQVAEARARVAAATRDVERWKGKDSGHLNELATLREKLERVKQAEQAIALTRAHLLAMETKLDVLEGAITVLDRRTRDRLEDGAGAPDIEASHTTQTS